MRGLVLPLTAEQRVARMRYLAGEFSLGMLDKFVRKSRAELISLEGYRVTTDVRGVMCPDLYYLLEEYNGGKDACAPDPATRWRKPRIPIIRPNPILNRTCDCIGGMSWCGGWDRLQPVQFAHLYNGWINTDSMRIDALTGGRCFKRIPVPEPGCYVVYASDPHGETHGMKRGHIGGVVDVPGEFAPEHREWWELLGVVNVGAYNGRANRRTTGLPWWRKDSMFVVPVLEPTRNVTPG